MPNTIPRARNSQLAKKGMVVVEFLGDLLLEGHKNSFFSIDATSISLFVKLQLQCMAKCHIEFGTWRKIYPI